LEGRETCHFFHTFPSTALCVFAQCHKGKVFVGTPADESTTLVFCSSKNACFTELRECPMGGLG
jgi:hypothetical protein